MEGGFAIVNTHMLARLVSCLRSSQKKLCSPHRHARESAKGRISLRLKRASRSICLRIS